MPASQERGDGEEIERAQEHVSDIWEHWGRRRRSAWRCESLCEDGQICGLTEGTPVEPNEAITSATQLRPVIRRGETFALDLISAHVQLQEKLHLAEAKLEDQSSEIDRLRKELEARTNQPDQKIQQLQDEIMGLTMIASQSVPAKSRS